MQTNQLQFKLLTRNDSSQWLLQSTHQDLHIGTREKEREKENNTRSRNFDVGLVSLVCRTVCRSIARLGSSLQLGRRPWLGAKSYPQVFWRMASGYRPQSHGSVGHLSSKIPSLEFKEKLYDLRVGGGNSLQIYDPPSTIRETISAPTPD